MEIKIIPEFTNPSLVKRHFAQLKSNKNDKRLLFYKQTHENYIFTFFQNLILDSSFEITINGVQGMVNSYVDFSSFNLKKPVDADFFYDSLYKVPFCFIFIPNKSLIELDNFCDGAFYFNNEYEGILMNLSFAYRVGVDFIGSSLIFNRNINSYYIGFIFK